MACYRLYFMTDAGHIRRCEDIIADSDGEALSGAAAHGGSQSRELRCATRLIQHHTARSGQT